MLMDCIDPGCARVRSGGAGDAVHRQAFATRQSRILGRPGGPSSHGLGTSSAGAPLAPPSRRTAILAQGHENSVQPVIITHTKGP